MLVIISGRSMSEMKHEMQSIHWTVKLLLTVIIGAVLSIGMFLLLIDVFGSRQFLILFLSGFVSPILVATLLFMREQNSLAQSVAKGVSFGLIGGAIILTLTAACFFFILSDMHIQS